ncbi:MAG: DUF4838 domain-containing protein [Clostridia bacterium]|nr:DUF4838 domain-containing protein [Clostridia bacterium]
MKRICAVLMATVFVLCSALSVYAEFEIWLEQSFLYDETFTLGDVNGDGAINAVDSMFIKTKLAGISNQELVLDAADFDADGRLSAIDSYNLKLCIAGVKATDEFENGKPIYRFTIAGNDVSEYAFVLPEGTTDEDNAYLAYRLLFKYFRYLTGNELPLYYGSAPTENTITFNVLDVESDEYGRELGYDGLKYEVVDGDLNIYGTWRGSMYAAYEIIEQYLGVRFYSDYETFVYKSRLTDIPEGTSVEIIPQLTYRFAKQTYSTNGALTHYFAHKHNGAHFYAFNEKRYGTLTGDIYGNAHSFMYYWQMSTGTMPPEGSLNPDGTPMTLYQRYQAKMDSGEPKDQFSWQPCATAQRDYDYMFNGMLDCGRMAMSMGLWDTYFEEGISMFSFSICDNSKFCSCRKCSQIQKKEGYSGLYVQMYNKACVDIQSYYPGARIYGIIYAKDTPATVLPEPNLVIQYCGVTCHNHILNQEQCFEGGGQLNDYTNDIDVVSLKYWGDACRKTGAELWYWVYPVNYHYLLVDTPNIPNLYFNTKFLIDECGVTGIAHEGNYEGNGYSFEHLKAYMMSRLMWDTDMTYDEWNEIMKEYLYIYYGPGYKYIFEYIGMQTEAGDQCGTCFVNNFDRPGDMFSYDYLGENYDTMRALLEKAYELADTPERIMRMEHLLVCCDFMALSALHTDWYVNGNNVELYTERYTWMYNKMVEYDMTVFSSEMYTVPTTCDVTVNPMTQIYGTGSRRPNIYP